MFMTNAWIGIIGTLLGTLIGFLLSLVKDYLSEKRVVKLFIDSCRIVLADGLENSGRQYFIEIRIIIQNNSSVTQPLWDFTPSFIGREGEPIYFDLWRENINQDSPLVVAPKTTVVKEYRWNEPYKINLQRVKPHRLSLNCRTVTKKLEAVSDVSYTGWDDV
jgi:hypothetical protein